MNFKMKKICRKAFKAVEKEKDPRTALYKIRAYWLTVQEHELLTKESELYISGVLVGLKHAIKLMEAL
jgi:hypothetical protein